MREEDLREEEPKLFNELINSSTFCLFVNRSTTPEKLIFGYPAILFFFLFFFYEKKSKK